MRSVARNLDEDLRSVSQGPTSCEATTRLSADKDDEDEEEDESNVSLLEGPNIMGSSPTMSSGSDTSTVVQKTLSNFVLENIVRTPQAGETLVFWWKRRLPLSSVFTGLKKGRTLRALSEAVSKLASHEDTLDDSNMLKLHEGRCRLAEQLRPERFRGLTWVDLRATLAMFGRGVGADP